MCKKFYSNRLFSLVLITNAHRFTNTHTQKKTSVAHSECTLCDIMNSKR